jgi:acyl-coenzyme A synthetase/AMP-(fatty) acid ligase
VRVPTESFLASFAEQVRRSPDAAALLPGDPADARPISYRELHLLARSAQAQLPEQGASAGPPVCVVGKKSPDLVALLLACFMAGHRVLLPPSDLGESTLLRLCEQAGCRYLIRVDAGQPAVQRLAPAADGPATNGLAASPVPAGLPVPHPPAGGPGLLLTTSGSTGLPKIVPLSARGIDRFIGWAADQFAIGPGAVVLNYAPLNFDLCLLDVWTTLARGACVALVGEDGATDGGRLLDLVARCTVVQAVPMLFRLLTDAAAAAGPGAAVGPCGAGLAGVRQVVFTGDAMSADLLGRVRRLFPWAALHNLYGCTETNDSFLHRVDAAPIPGTAVPIGRPIAGVTAVVLDGDGCILAGPGAGELLVRTPFQAAGYLDQRLDEGRFVAAPAGLPQGRYYRTGDLVRRDVAGLVTLVGRADFQVKVRGVRVNTEEVEAVIAQHPEVLEVAVAAVPDRLAGHRLCAVIRRTPNAAVNSLGLRQHCAARLPRAAIPGHIELVAEPLPRTSTGKLDRKQIRHPRLGGS